MMTGPWSLPFLGSALNTAKAALWTIWCARLFGRKVVSEDDNTRVIAYWWRGKLYLTDVHSL